MRGPRRSEERQLVLVVVLGGCVEPAGTARSPSDAGRAGLLGGGAGGLLRGGGGLLGRGAGGLGRATSSVDVAFLACVVVVFALVAVFLASAFRSWVACWRRIRPTRFLPRSGEVDVLLVQVVDGAVELGDELVDLRLDARREGLASALVDARRRGCGPGRREPWARRRPWRGGSARRRGRCARTRRRRRRHRRRRRTDGSGWPWWC